MPGLSNGVKGFRSKTFPTPLTGVSWGRFFKALKCYEISLVRTPKMKADVLAKVEKCIPSHLLSPGGEDEGEGDIFRLHPHPNPLPPAGEGQ